MKPHRIATIAFALTLLVALSFLVELSFPSLAWAGRRRIVDRVKIRVNDRVVTALEVEELRNIKINVLKSRFKGKILKEKLASLEKELENSVVEDLLLESHAERLNLEIGDKQIENRVDRILRRQPSLAEIYSNQQLKSLVLKDILRQRVLALEVDSRIRITDNDIVITCREAQGKDKEVDVGHILIRGNGEDSLKKISALRERLEKGDEFEALALAHSQDPSAKQNKGRLGFISKGQFVKNFEAVAFSLPVGGLSQPVSTQFGFHLIRVFSTRIKNRRECGKLDRAARQVFRNQVFARLRKNRLKAFLSGLRKKAEIKIFN